MKSDISKHCSTQSPTWLSHIILNAETDAISKLTEKQKFDMKNCDLKITLNGIEFKDEKFEVFLDWVINQYTEQLDEKTKQLDKLILKKAKEILEEKFTSLQQKMSDLEYEIDDLLPDSYNGDEDEEN